VIPGERRSREENLHDLDDGGCRGHDPQDVGTHMSEVRQEAGLSTQQDQRSCHMSMLRETDSAEKEGLKLVGSQQFRNQSIDFQHRRTRGAGFTESVLAAGEDRL